MDLLSKQNITYIIIFIFIILSLTNVCNRNNEENDVEAFQTLVEDQRLLDASKRIFLPSMETVQFATVEAPNTFESLDAKFNNTKTQITNAINTVNTRLDQTVTAVNTQINSTVTAVNTQINTLKNSVVSRDASNNVAIAGKLTTQGFFSNYIQCNTDDTRGRSPGVGYFNGLSTGWLEAGSTLKVDGKSTFNNSINIATDIVVTPWFSNTGNAPFVISAKTVPVDKGNLSITTTDWGSNNTYSTMNIIGRFHLVCSENFDIYIKGGMNIYKNADIPGSGNLSVGGTLNVNGQATFNAGLNALNVGHTVRGLPGHNLHIASKLTLYLMARHWTYVYKCKGDCADWEDSSGNFWVEGELRVNGATRCYGNLYTNYVEIGNGGEEGPRINLINTDKVGSASVAREWSIWNMRGVYGDSLQFWKYPAGGAQLILFDNGISKFTGNLEVSGVLTANRIEISSTEDRGVLVVPTGGYIWVGEGRSSDNLCIYTAGTIYARSGWVAASDRRLKENIKNVTQNEKDKLLQLVPKTYNFISDKKKEKRYGLIAQEVEEIFPELVTINSDDGMRALNYTDLIPLLIEQIKDMNKQIQYLTTMIRNPNYRNN